MMFLGPRVLQRTMWCEVELYKVRLSWLVVQCFAIVYRISKLCGVAVLYHNFVQCTIVLCSLSVSCCAVVQLCVFCGVML